MLAFKNKILGNKYGYSYGTKLKFFYTEKVL